MSWNYTLLPSLQLLVKGRIDEVSAQRQHRTAAELLRRLHERPGQVLADEVGMGKTFVALSVAASVALEATDVGPVVVMVPSSVREKWPKEARVFAERCLGEGARGRLKFAKHTATSGIELLKLLDDPPERRKHIVFATHGALSGGMTDRWVRLALIRRALERSSLSDVRRVFPRFAASLLQLQTKGATEELFEDLLRADPKRWFQILERYGLAPDDGDDPVPEALRDSIRDLDRKDIDVVAEALQGMPRKDSPSLSERLTSTRRELKKAIDLIWKKWLAHACRRVKLPLLILDEAHHVKNADTQLAKLFADAEGEEAAEMLGGPLHGVFERMLFLTATPFQLGHNELLRVMRRFLDVEWQGESAPGIGRDAAQAELDQLASALDRAQTQAIHLDRAWSRLRLEHLGPTAEERGVDAWWEDVQAGRAGPSSQETESVLRRYQETFEAKRAAEALLQPWVVRHSKPKLLDASGTPRRSVLEGAAVVDPSRTGGIEVEGESLLPFLLAARATASVARVPGARALFAEGLASSYEAFRETRSGKVEVDDLGEEALVPVADEVGWYLEHIDRLLPDGSDASKASHPKVKATVEAAVRFWEAGEKLLVFCFYRATGRALQRHISSAIDDAMTRLAARRFERSPEEAEEHLEVLSKRLQSGKGPLAREAAGELQKLVAGAVRMSTEQREKTVDVMERFLRTPSFLARYFPNHEKEGAIVEALATKDGSGLTLRSRFEAFARFLEQRIEEADDYLAALDSLQTGTRRGREADEQARGEEAERLLPNVRLVNGATKQETRQRILQAFNAPFLPEVLVASSVMAEGVDLHLDCRHVIHHDLDWNPSTLEQRTGRVDRLGAKAERAVQPIEVYLPYVAATQDEKMFRVVTARERWFQVVMGNPYSLDEGATEKEAARVAFPAAAAEALAFRLEVGE